MECSWRLQLQIVPPVISPYGIQLFKDSQVTRSKPTALSSGIKAPGDTKCARCLNTSPYHLSAPALCRCVMFSGSWVSFCCLRFCNNRACKVETAASASSAWITVRCGNRVRVLHDVVSVLFVYLFTFTAWQFWRQHGDRQCDGCPTLIGQSARCQITETCSVFSHTDQFTVSQMKIGPFISCMSSAQGTAIQELPPCL